MGHNRKMKVLPSVLILAANGQGMGDGYTAGAGLPIDDILRRLKNLKKWGNECAANINGKRNINRKIYNFDRNAVRYWNFHNDELDALDTPDHWCDDHEDQPWCQEGNGPQSDDRTISTENPCECLWRVGRAYTNFYTRGFGDDGKPHTKAKHMWRQMNNRLEKSYGCDFSNMGYNNPKPTDPPTEPPTQPTVPYPDDDPTEPTPSCPDGWTKFDDEDRCFKTKCQDSAMLHIAANEQCQDWSADLTMVKSAVQ